MSMMSGRVQRLYITCTAQLKQHAVRLFSDCSLVDTSPLVLPTQPRAFTSLIGISSSCLQALSERSTAPACRSLEATLGDLSSLLSASCPILSVAVLAK